ncbi:MAG: YxeA family protein [Clostridiales bacterium]|nr:YxeA family protein [Clostridiales bacterium]
MKSKMLIILGTVLFLICCTVGGLYYFENHKGIYYSQIDNTKMKELSTSNNMKYEYTLACYNKNGQKKTLKFKTSRELREDAYILLEVRMFGVHRWEEVQYDELPAKVQNKYQE